MNERYLIIGALFAVLAIGFIRLLVKRNRLITEGDFAQKYLSKFQKFATSYRDKFDGQLYYWLTHRAVKMQSQMGVFGQVDYKPPAANYYIRNYQFIVNTLPLMRSGMTYLPEVAMCEDALIRYIGLVDDRLASSSKRLKNPFIWLQEGVQLILALPVLVLHWSGLISITAIDSLTENLFFKVLSGLIILTGLVASVFTIALGWEEFLSLFR